MRLALENLTDNITTLESTDDEDSLSTHSEEVTDNIASYHRLPPPPAALLDDVSTNDDEEYARFNLDTVEDMLQYLSDYFSHAHNEVNVDDDEKFFSPTSVDEPGAVESMGLDDGDVLTLSWLEGVGRIIECEKRK